MTDDDAIHIPDRKFRCWVNGTIPQVLSRCLTPEFSSCKRIIIFIFKILFPPRYSRYLKIFKLISSTKKYMGAVSYQIVGAVLTSKLLNYYCNQMNVLYCCIIKISKQFVINIHFLKRYIPNKNIREHWVIGHLLWELSSPDVQDYCPQMSVN